MAETINKNIKDSRKRAIANEIIMNYSRDALLILMGIFGEKQGLVEE